MMYLTCKNCQQRVSDFLILSDQRWVRNDYSALTDKYLVQTGYYVRDNEQQYIINVLDKRHLAYHADSKRFAGCCGPAMDGEPNLICQCKTEIGREVTDCLGPHFIKIRAEKVIEVRDEWQLFSILQQVESAQLLPEGQLDSMLTLLHYGQQKQAVTWLKDSLQTLKAEALLQQLNQLPTLA